MFTRKNDLVSTPPRRNNAFTLAEVLITLVIIGVIAAITVPTLIAKTQKQEYVSRLKKAYSTMSQATNKIIAEEGPVTSWNLTFDNAGRKKMFELYKKHLNNAKECGETGCWTQGTIKRINGEDGANLDLNGSHQKLVLADGTQVIFFVDSPDCSATWYDSNQCARIYVDVNGAKKPNTIGRDIFAFTLKKDGLYPVGCRYTCTNNPQGEGWACTCSIFKANAMNY